MADELLPQDELPPDSDRPGLRSRFARVAVDTRPLRDSRSFRLLWTGQAVSDVGSRITLVAIPFQVYEITGSTLAVGLISLFELVPLLAFALVGGAIADATDRRRLILLTEIGLMAVTGGLVVNALLSEPRVWILYVLAALGIACSSLGRPAMNSLVPLIVAKEQIPAAMALEGIYGSFGAVAGPALGGVLIATIGLPLTYGLDILTFAASLATVWALPSFPPVPDADRAGIRSMLEGLRFVRNRKILLGIFLVDTNAMIFGMPSALFPAVADRQFHAGAEVVGLLYAAPYAGALVASLLSGWMGQIHRQGIAVAIAAACWGLALVGFGLASALWLALFMLALAGAADMVSAIFRSTIVFAATPEGMRGRILGIELAQVVSAPTLGNVEAGVVAALTNIRTSIVSGGILCVAGTAVACLAIPQLLRYDSREPER